MIERASIYPPLTDPVPVLTCALVPYLNKHFALFSPSRRALISFELARYLSSQLGLSSTTPVRVGTPRSPAAQSVPACCDNRLSSPAGRPKGDGRLFMRCLIQHLLRSSISSTGRLRKFCETLR